jgi:serine protease Do
MSQVRWSLFPALTVCAALTFAPSAWAQQREEVRRDGTKVKSIFKEVIATAKESTVRIYCKDNDADKDVALGTVVGKDGWVLTKFSELKGESWVRLRDGRSFAAKLVGVHEPYDLAMLKIPVTDLKPVEWRESKTVAPGDWVACPGLSEVPVAVGVIGVATRKPNRFEMPVAPNPNSGFLGVSLEEADGGVRITRVEAEGGAEKAGVKANDVILAVNGMPTPEPEALQGIIQKLKPGDKAVLKIKRGDKEMELTATLGKRPTERGGFDRADMQNRMGNEMSVRRGGFPLILQHDAYVKPVDCGGPLVDLEGKTIGINLARAGRVETFAAPAEAIQALVPDLESGKFPPPPVPTAAEKKLSEAKAAFEKVEKDRADLEKRGKDAKAAFDKAEKERADTEKRAKDAKEALDKVEKERAAMEKRAKDAKEALDKAEEEARKEKEKPAKP